MMSLKTWSALLLLSLASDVSAKSYDYVCYNTPRPSCQAAEFD